MQHAQVQIGMDGNGRALDKIFLFSVFLSQEHRRHLPTPRHGGMLGLFRIVSRLAS